MVIKGPICLAISGPKVSQNSGLWSFSKKPFSLDSHQYCFTCTWTLRCVKEVGLRGPLLGDLDPKISKNFGLLSFPKKNSTGFTSVLVYMSVWATFNCLLNIGLRGLISGQFGPKIDHNSGLHSFSEIFSTGFTSWFYMHTFMCI